MGDAAVAHTRDGRFYEVDPLTYDALDRPLTVRTQGPASSWETETFTYDHEGPDTYTAGADTLVAGLTYNARGQMTLFDRAGAVPDTAYNYKNAAGNFRLDYIAHDDTWDAFPDFDYVYDDVGNITQLQTFFVDGGNQTDTQTFDVENRLEWVYSSDGTETLFAYDPSGQRTRTVDSVPQTSQTMTYYPFPGYEEELIRSWECVGPKSLP